MTCIYVAIGQKASTMLTWSENSKKPVRWNTHCCVASASDSAALQFLAPYLVVQWVNISEIVVRIH